MGISDEQLEAMRAEARSSGGGGTFVILDEPGEFLAGTVTGLFDEVTSFGEVEEVGLVDVRTKFGALDGERRLRLSRSVLKRELGSESEDGPVKVGQSIYVEYHGEAMSKAGRQFHRYTVKRFDNVPEAAASSESNPLDTLAKAQENLAQMDAEEMPF